MKDEDKTKEQLLQEIAGLRREKRELELGCRRLHALDKENEDALHRVSHELRAPITAIRSFTEILLECPMEDSKTKAEYLSIIRGESERLTRLIGSLMEMSKIKHGNTHGQLEKIRLQPLVEESAKALQSLVFERGLILEARIEPTLPVFMADADRIRQVLNNILANAIEFTPPAGRIWIEAEFLEGKRCESAQGFIHVWVSDTGVGIKPEDLPNVFDRFKQCGDALMRRPSGLGLGLFICKEIVSAHGGNIWAVSTPGEGSTFHFTLPAAMSGEGSYQESLLERSYSSRDRAGGPLSAT
jgi:signal transduction histidine kinase